MFTGITAGTFPVASVEATSGLVTLTLELGPALIDGLEIGASVAVDGVCLTVVKLDGPRVRFDVIAETLKRTTLGSLIAGSRVSVERSYRLGQELGGHEVSGHVIGTGTVSEVRRAGGVHELTLRVPEDWMRFVFEKGFIAVDGSSLTVGRVGADSFDISLIPETIRLTNLGTKQVGDRVNIELDARTVAVVQTVERVL